MYQAREIETLFNCEMNSSHLTVFVLALVDVGAGADWTAGDVENNNPSERRE